MASSERIRGIQVHRPIIYGSTARLLNPDEREGIPPEHTHRWTIFLTSAAPTKASLAGLGAATATATSSLDAPPTGPLSMNHVPGGGDDLSYLIKKVTFRLHETIPNPSRVIDKPPYQVTETGWGEFSVPIKIQFVGESGEKTLNLSHTIRLHHWGPPIEALPPPPVIQAQVGDVDMEQAQAEGKENDGDKVQGEGDRVEVEKDGNATGEEGQKEETRKGEEVEGTAQRAEKDGQKDHKDVGGDGDNDASSMQTEKGKSDSTEVDVKPSATSEAATTTSGQVKDDAIANNDVDMNSNDPGANAGPSRPAPPVAEPKSASTTDTPGLTPLPTPTPTPTSAPIGATTTAAANTATATGGATAGTGTGTDASSAQDGTPTTKPAPTAVTGTATGTTSTPDAAQAPPVPDSTTTTAGADATSTLNTPAATENATTTTAAPATYIPLTPLSIAQRYPVHAWQYDEIVLHDPPAAFLEILNQHTPTPLPARGTRVRDLREVHEVGKKRKLGLTGVAGLTFSASAAAAAASGSGLGSGSTSRPNNRRSLIDASSTTTTTATATATAPGASADTNTDSPTDLHLAPIEAAPMMQKDVLGIPGEPGSADVPLEFSAEMERAEWNRLNDARVGIIVEMDRWRERLIEREREVVRLREEMGRGK